MTVISGACFLAALAILASCLPKNADVFSPGRVFGLIWTIAIGLADLKLSKLQHEWPLTSWVTLLLGVGSFLLGVLCVRMLTYDRPVMNLGQLRTYIRTIELDNRRFFNIILLLVGLYTLCYVIEWRIFGSLPIFSARPERARIEYGVFGLHLVVISMPAILFLIVEYLLLVRGDRKRKAILLFCFAMVFITTFLLLNRLFYVFFLISAVVLAYYTTSLVRLRNVALVLAPFLAVLTYLQSLRESKYIANFLYHVSGMKYSETYAWATGPYMYIVMNLENFAHGVRQLTTNTYGFYTFDFLLALTGLKHQVEQYFGLEKQAFLTSGYNTYSFLWEYYYDFGLLGMFVLPLLVGFVIAAIHHWMREKPNLVRLTLYSVAVYFMALSFFTNSLAALNFNFNVLLMVAVQFFIVRRQLLPVPPLAEPA